MTTLKDFIKETTIQICEAIVEIASEKGETGANPNPPIDLFSGTTLLPGPQIPGKQRRDTIMAIEFDVAVTAEETQSKEGGGGIQVLSLRVGGSAGKETVESSVSRVKFTLPLRLPDTNADGPPLRPRPHVPSVSYD